MNAKKVIILLGLLLFTGCGGPGTSADRITGTFRYLDSDGNRRPIAFAKVEIHSYTPGTVGWGLAATTTTDVNGSISVPVPLAKNGVVYAVKVFATNYAAVVWPNDVAHTVAFHREPGEPGSPINRKYGTDPLDFTYDFTDDWTTQHYNLAETIRLANDYAAARRDPNETDILPAANVQPTSASVGGTFYDPAVDTITIDSSDVFNDLVLIHEYAHFVEEQIGSFVWQASDHNGCTAYIRDPTVPSTDPPRALIIMNNAEHAWMEGFADYFAQAVIRSLPAGTIVNTGQGSAKVDTLENQPTDCNQAVPALPAGYPPETIEYRVAGTLWDLVDPTGTAAIETHDTIADQDLEVFQIFDRELDTYGTGPTICYFRNAWLARGLDQAALDAILAHNGITNCKNSTPPTWGDFQRDACLATGVRQYSAILWNIPSGMSWEAACASTSATIAGQDFSGADRCVESGGHMWGQFDISDSSCAPRWGDLKQDACLATGVRQYSAILWDIPPGEDWEDACYTTPATIEGQNFPGATRCKNTGTNIWGEFDITDTSCASRWGDFKKDACVATNIRQYSAILWDIPSGVDWEDSCYSTPAMIEGQNFSGAARCKNTGTNIWGEFDITDSSCSARWGDFKKDACRKPGIRQYSAILWDIPSGVDWENTCYTTPATIEGQNFPGATRCVNTGNMWGEFDVSDTSCK